MQHKATYKQSESHMAEASPISAAKDFARRDVSFRSAPLILPPLRMTSFVFLFVFLAFNLQGCLGIGGSNTPAPSTFQKKSTGNNGSAIGINTTNQAVFNGKIYFTLNRNLYVLDGQRQIHQLTHGMDIRDPAVSPDGKSVAFVIRYKDYSNLAMMPSGGGPIRILRSGNGGYIPNPPYPAPRSTYNWYAQPSWAPDSKHLLFLSDFEKFNWNPGVDAFLLDLQVFSISINDPVHAQDVAYAAYGDGGNRDPSYRPHHPDQIIYTHFAYDSSQTRQLIQLYLEDPNAIANNPNKGYKPGLNEYDPAIALTPPVPDLVNMEPAFSPDGNSLAYVRRQDATHMGLYIMPVAEGVTKDPNNPTVEKQALVPYSKSALILTAQYVSQPVWSPNGKQIAYLTYTNNAFDIWLVSVALDAKTGAYKMQDSPVQLTDAGGQLDADSRPFWTA